MWSTSRRGDYIYLGSEQNLRVDRIDAGGAVRLKSGEGLVNVDSSGDANVKGGNIILEAASANIGASDNFFTVDMIDTNDEKLTARAGDSIYLRELVGSQDIGLKLDSVYAVNYVEIDGESSIYDAYDDDKMDAKGYRYGGLLNIKTHELKITAVLDIGLISNYIEIDMPWDSKFYASAGRDIFLAELIGDMNVDRAISTGGDVGLWASNSLKDWNEDLAADAIGENIFLTAYNGNISGADDGDFEIDSDLGDDGDGTLTSFSEVDTFLKEFDGDLYLMNIATGYGTAFIDSTESILNGNPGPCTEANPGGCNITSGEVRLYAVEDIGAELNPLTSTKNENSPNVKLEGYAHNGGCYVANSGILQTGEVTPAANGVECAGPVIISASSPVIVATNIISGGSVTITARDSVGAGDDITVNAGVTIQSANAHIWLRAGDDLHIDPAATLDADQFIRMDVDYHDAGVGVDADPGVGGEAYLYGTLKSGTDIRVFGNGDNDYILMDIANGGEIYPFGMDLRGGSDLYRVDLSTGDRLLVNVSDSGANDDGVDRLTINGSVNDDLFLLRRDFVAFINEGVDSDGDGYDDFARINYNQQINGRLRINAYEGEDAFYVDDNSSITTLDGGDGADYFQFGQLFKSAREAGTATGILPGDEFETVETTRGFLSNGISQPLTAYGADGNDFFQVYHNLAVLRLEGGDHDDTFIVRAFVVLNEAAKQAMTYINSGGGNDKIQYVINAPVSIDGGDGYDSVVVIGTEFQDNFVITKDGIYGAGLNVTYERVESIELDAMEGDDNFFVLSTHEDWSAVVIGNKGSDIFNVAGDVDVDVISNDLMGYSAVIHHEIVTQDPYYQFAVINDVQLRASGYNEAAVVINETNAASQVDETLGGGTVDTYDVRLSSQPSHNVYLTVSAPTSQMDEQALGGKTVSVSKDGINYDFGVVLVFTPDNWDTSQTLTVQAGDDTLNEGDRFVEVSHSVISADSDYNGVAIRNVRVETRDNDRHGLVINQSDNKTEVVESGTPNEDTYNISLTHAPAAGQIVTVDLSLDSVSTDQLTFVSATTLTFDDTNWDTEQTITIQAREDDTAEGIHRARILHTLSSTDSNFDGSVERLDVTVRDKASAIITETDGTTFVITGASDGSEQDTYDIVLTTAPEKTAGIDAADNDTDPEGGLDIDTITISVDPANGTAYLRYRCR